MIVTHIDGRSELLTDYKSLQRKRKVNGEYSLSFLLFKTDRNAHSYPLAVEESLIEYDGQEYRIKKMSEKTIGKTPVKQIQADHIFFDLVDCYQYETISGAKQLTVCLAFALEGTGYRFEVVDPFASVEFENFGNDNALSLIQTCLNRFGAEVEINGKYLRFYRRIGRKTDIQYRYKHNIKTIEKHVDSSNLSTYIKGFGKQNEDGSYVVTADYLSPLHTYYGIRHAKPVYDERYTTYSGLLERLQNDLQDTPEISITLEAVELKKAGINTEQLELGDDVFTIYEPLDIDINARIVEIIEFPEEPVSNQFTIANFRGSVVDSIADFQRTKDRIDGIFEGKEKLPFNVLDDAVQRATLALQSAQTELEFENGIIARDPSDANRLMIITSTGIGISTDGGKTFKEAITADGFVLSAGAIGQLSANNITIGNGTKFEPGYDPKEMNDMLTVWKYPGTTLIDGGSIFTNSIDVNSIKVGTLLGFKIQTKTGSDQITIENRSIDIIDADNIIRLSTKGALFDGPSIDFDLYERGNQASIGYQNSGLTMFSGGIIRIHAIDFLSLGSSNSTVDLDSNTRVRGDFNVIGAKNASVPTSIGMVNVSAYETAEYYFGDIGRGEVVNGECIIDIESLFAETVNTEIQYEVFLTPYGPGQIYVDPESMTADSFIVKGDDIPFAYEIKAKRRGYEDVRLEATYESEVESVAY
ncbi:phage tail protein [Sporosarcina contaminans]|uniref:Phage tail protein n=1 Tax=Sporosarcina contaminans TaxID=633403 RepID=A0ABW3TVM0_9BACL